MSAQTSILNSLSTDREPAMDSSKTPTPAQRRAMEAIENGDLDFAAPWSLWESLEATGWLQKDAWALTDAGRAVIKAES